MHLLFYIILLFFTNSLKASFVCFKKKKINFFIFSQRDSSKHNPEKLNQQSKSYR